MSPEALEHLAFSTSCPSGFPSKSRRYTHMTKFVVKSEWAQVFDILRTPLGVLFYPAIIAYHESKRILYIADPYAEATISRLTEAGFPTDVVRL